MQFTLSTLVAAPKSYQHERIARCNKRGSQVVSARPLLKEVQFVEISLKAHLPAALFQGEWLLRIWNPARPPVVVAQQQNPVLPIDKERV